MLRWLIAILTLAGVMSGCIIAPLPFHDHDHGHHYDGHHWH